MYLRNMTAEQYHELVLPYIKEAVKADYDTVQIAEILHQRVSVLGEINEMLDFFDNYPSYENDLYNNKKMKTNPEVALSSLKAARATLAETEDWSQANLHDVLMNLVQTLGIKNGQLLFPVRIALTGKAFTPGGAIEIAAILGKEESLKRLDASIAQLEA